ncbi:glutamate racemase [Paenibacillus xerothermodurans]|uniref:Glutamate racemase n=1 Tax=Paenibacillus xerothermodurans TaxID=1977292 RepID=A0A2W1ND41_PAEXE|nr:glutamate racemase [Paenibacillus xerothermodurans]PZE21001.1 glutamate racemase [Paenibacillus xerothermodurans]
MQQAIAILDSGVGGLTVAKEVMRQLPLEKIMYFGDTARTPYGPREPDEVIRFTHQIVSYLLQFQPKMVVIACNTATAVALEEIRSRLTIPVVGVIHPGARAAIKNTRSGRIGVIGTEGTIKSGAYELALRQITPHIEVVSQACPAFVPLVEKGLFHTPEAHAAVAQSLRQFQQIPMDCLILGCTHYPFLRDTIAEVMGPKVNLISSADETAREISTVLYHKGLLATTNSMQVHQFFCSGDPWIFKKIAQEWLNEEIKVTPVVWQVPHIS